MTDLRQATSLAQDALAHLSQGDTPDALDALDAAHAAMRWLDAETVDRVGRWSDLPAWTRVVDALSDALDRRDGTRLRLATARAQLAAGCPETALDTADPLPDDEPRALIVRGQAWLALGRGGEAATCFDAALALDDTLVAAHVGRAGAIVAQAKVKEARAAWERVLELAPDHGPARRRVAATRRAMTPTAPTGDTLRVVRWARALLRDGRLDEAAEVLEALRAKAPSDPWILAAVARARHARGLHDEAREAVERAAAQPCPPDLLVDVGQAMRTLGHTDAPNVLRAAAEDGADIVIALAGAADGLQRLGHADDALAIADQALLRDPACLQALLASARAKTARGDAPAAKEAWRAVLEVAPGHPEAVRGLDAGTSEGPGRTERGVARIHFDLGRSMLQRGRHREALNAFRNAAEIRPDWADPWRQLGLTYQLLDERPAAIDAFRKALERAPDDVDAATALGDLHREQGAPKMAQEAYDAALAAQGDHLRARVGRGEVHRLQGRFDEAVTDFEAALASTPDDATALVGLAASLNGLRRFAEARPVWVRARERDPSSTFVAKGLAQCHAGLRGTAPLAFEDVAREPQPKRAAAWAERDETYDRYEAMDHVDRGRSYQKERNYAKAINCFKKALEIDPTCDEAALRLGMAYEDDRQFRRAIAAYRTCLEIEPNHYQAATNIGEAYRKNEQYREAIAAYDQALAMKPDYLYALAGRAECMRMLGRYEESLGWFDRALEVGPNHAFALQGKAAALNSIPKFEEALEFWERALEIEPHSQFAQEGKAACEHAIARIDVTPTADDAIDEELPDSATPTLDEQGRDLSALARAGKLPKVIGRDKEIRQVMKTLVRRLKANPLLLGEPGVGKTAVVEGLAQRLAEGRGHPRLADLRIVELQMGSLIAGTKYRGTFEERLREIVKEATTEPGLVLFIDEIHTLVGAGRTEGGSLDAANILKPALARGEITVIGATTHAEYRAHFETDSALERRFQPITIEEPSEDDCVELLGKLAPTYSAHHEVEIRDEALVACVQMAVRFLPDRRLPDKALDMLDEACAEANLSGEAVVDQEVVARVVSERTGVPVQKLTQADVDRMDRIEEALGARVLGQEAAVARLGNAVRLSMAGLRAPDRPRAVFLFQGPSGVGKTELAKALADELFPEGDALVRLDMSEYADRFTTTRLLGAPPGMAGHGEEGSLTGPLRRKPYSVVLLDEFEKAHPDVQSTFLSLLDEGILHDADGRKVNAREAFFILTTNAGTATTVGGRMGFSGTDDSASAALDALRPYFRPELLDRIDEVIPFADLDTDALRAIARQRLGLLAERADDQGLHIRFDDSVVEHLVGLRRPGERGARQLLRAIDQHAGEALGRLLLKHPDGPHRSFHAHMVEGEVRFDEAQPDAAPVGV